MAAPNGYREVHNLIDDLRANNPERKIARIPFGPFRHNTEVEAVAQELHGNEFANEFYFSFSNNSRPDLVDLDWNPLLNELATRAKLEIVRIEYIPDGHFLQLFRNQLFQALQNAHVQSLELWNVRLSNSDTEGIISFLGGGAIALTDVSLEQCLADGATVASDIASALLGNNRIQSLTLSISGDVLLCRAIFQGLASSHSAPCLRKLVYKPAFLNDEENESLAEDLRHYLESPNATIQHLEIHNFNFNYPSGSEKILSGLSRNTSVDELAFDGCYIRDEEEEDEGNEAGHEYAQKFADLLRSKPELASLSLCRGDFLGFRLIGDAVTEMLTQRASSLRCLEFSVSANIALFNMNLQDFMNAVVSSTQLERLLVRGIATRWVDILRTFEDSIPLLKVKELTVFFHGRSHDAEGRLLAALKRNYTVQNVIFKEAVANSNANWFSEANQARLESYVDRNRKLAQWVENPKMVPRELWSYAMTLALKAGVNPLFQSLLALSGQGIGLRQRGRKRKRPQYFKPA